MTRKRPWNRTDQPVYSISSVDNMGNYNMNMITYVTAVSMHPKRFICGVYENTRTLTNLSGTSQFVLQLLHENQYNLLSVLGRKSGNQVDKIRLFEKRNLLSEFSNFKILKEALAVIKMKVIHVMKGGDHTIFLCDVIEFENLNDGKPLTLDILRDKKLIRI